MASVNSIEDEGELQKMVLIFIERIFKKCFSFSSSFEIV